MWERSTTTCQPRNIYSVCRIIDWHDILHCLEHFGPIMVMDMQECACAIYWLRSPAMGSADTTYIQYSDWIKLNSTRTRVGPVHVRATGNDFLCLCCQKCTQLTMKRGLSVLTLAYISHLACLSGKPLFPMYLRMKSHVLSFIEFCFTCLFDVNVINRGGPICEELHNASYEG